MKTFFEHVGENRRKCSTVIAGILATLCAIRSDLLSEAIRTDRVGFYRCLLLHVTSPVCARYAVGELATDF